MKLAGLYWRAILIGQLQKKVRVRPSAMPSSPAMETAAMEATTVKATTVETAKMARTGKVVRRCVIEPVFMTIPMFLPGMVHCKAGLATAITTPVWRIAI